MTWGTFHIMYDFSSKLGMHFEYLKCTITLFQKYALRNCVQYQSKMQGSDFLILGFFFIFYKHSTFLFNSQRLQHHNKCASRSFCITSRAMITPPHLRQAAKYFKLLSYHSSSPQNTYFGMSKIFQLDKKMHMKETLFPCFYK